MTHRDRAWRRRKSRIVELHEQETRDLNGRFLKDANGKSVADTRPHPPGKLTHAQALRQDWQLREDAAEGWSGDAVLPTLAHGEPTGEPLSQD